MSGSPRKRSFLAASSDEVNNSLLHLSLKFSAGLHDILADREEGDDEVDNSLARPNLDLSLQDFTIFLPTVKKAMMRHKLVHERFSGLAATLLHHAAPCMSDAEDWETSPAFLAEEHLAHQR